MIEPVSGPDRTQSRLTAQVEQRAARLEAYVAAGGGDPAPQPGTLAALAAGPIPINKVQQVQALLAETARLARGTGAGRPDATATAGNRPAGPGRFLTD